MQRTNLLVGLRETNRKSDVKNLRVDGFVPAVLYGFGKVGKDIQVESATLVPILKEAAGTTLLIDLEVEGEKEAVTSVIREVQRDPVSRQILHCDFLKVDMTRKYHVTVPVVITGEAEGVRTFSGVMDQHIREIDIKCLPGEIPEQYVIDVNDMNIGDSIRVEQIVRGDEEFLTSDDATIVSIIAPRAIIEEEAEGEEAVEGVEGEAAEEGEEGEAAEEGEKKKEE